MPFGFRPEPAFSLAGIRRNLQVHRWDENDTRYCCRIRVKTRSQCLETKEPSEPLIVVSLRSSRSAKWAAIASAYVLYMDQNIGGLVPECVSRRAAYGEFVCWITPYNSDDCKAWIPLGYGDPQWLWHHEALAFAALQVGEHPSTECSPARN
jgi:hypothetical protein